MDPLELTRREFTRQAGAISRAPAFDDPRLISRIQAALGAHGAGRILDLACGPGILAADLAPGASSLVGIDVTPEMVERARERCHGLGLEGLAFRVAEAEALPFSDREFDAVVTRLAVHHFRDPARVLAEVRRVLAHDGVLVLADVVTSENAPDATLHNALEQLRDPSHVRMLSPRELRDAVEAADLEVLSEESWEVERSFEEWAAIVDDEDRTAPLRQVMTHLAQAGHQAGIGLREADGTVHFIHSWLLLRAGPARQPCNSPI